MNPASWSSSDVEDWARQVGLPESTIKGLSENEVDGPTLVTLEKDELKSELGINSLPARRYLWDLIATLRSYQNSSDRATAIDILEEELENLHLQTTTTDEVKETTETDKEVVNQLRNDAAQQRQIISDHIFALRIQSFETKQTYEDAELAHAEEERLRQLSIQCEFDQRYAQSLDRNGMERPGANYEQDRSQIASLFGLSIQACISNKVNVAEALANGQIRVIPRLQDLELSNPNEAKEEEKEMDKISTREFLRNLPIIDHCNVCMEERDRGFALACDHCMCVGCTRQLFSTAIQDSSLLPLRCCEIPIDMSISRHILPARDSEKLALRMSERDASNKMYCPTCNQFINLDLVDVQEWTELRCSCETVLCILCKTKSHQSFTCAENKAIVNGDDALLLEVADQEGWKQCPNCNTMIELTHGCNHITCASCNHEFCFKCLSPWGGRVCSTNVCEVWDEDRLIAAGEARVAMAEHNMRRPLPPNAREYRIQQAMLAVQENEGCHHEWVRREGFHGNCERCGFELNCYGMRCRSDCESTVCYTCAQFRIPMWGWH